MVLFPISAIGKLLFTKSSGEVSSCSGGAGSTKVVVTAAHCVMNDSGDWNGNFIFVGGCGTGAQEIYAVQCIAVLTKWGGISGDVGAGVSDEA
jgi:V8-like Glu-specific endopeptidase